MRTASLTVLRRLRVLLATLALTLAGAAVSSLGRYRSRHGAYIWVDGGLNNLQGGNFAADLAQLVVRDGEGATKFVTVTVEGAPTYKDAHAVASRISTSALVKTALFGEDAK